MHRHSRNICIGQQHRWSSGADLLQSGHVLSEYSSVVHDPDMTTPSLTEYSRIHALVSPHLAFRLVTNPANHNHSVTKPLGWEVTVADRLTDSDRVMQHLDECVQGLLADDVDELHPLVTVDRKN